MIATIQYNTKKFQIDLSKPLDISIPIQATKTGVKAWGMGEAKIFPEEQDGQKILVSEGASVNFNSIHFNPHSHSTHTETVGHITKKIYTIHQKLNQFFFLTELITVVPEQIGDDMVISKKQLQSVFGNKKRTAIVIRTLPNMRNDKMTANYFNTNPPYLLEEAAIFLREKGIKHLLIDLISVDKEKDDGMLLAHHAFWNTSKKVRVDATITELIYVPNTIIDGTYFLNLMVAPFENDASPSKPILYEIF